MERRVYLYSTVAILLGILLVVLPNYLLQSTVSNYSFTRTKTEESNESLGLAPMVSDKFTQPTERLDFLQNLLIMLTISLVSAYLVFRVVRGRYGLF